MVTGTIWYKVKCECGKVNWINAGHFPDNDITGTGTDGFNCWNCKKEFPFIEEDEASFGYPEDGQEKPS